MRHVAAAARLLEQLNVKAYPIEVMRIADHLGITVALETFDKKDNLSGVLIKDGPNARIVINKADPVTRQRFTLAHEIGHFVMRHKGELFVDNTDRLPRNGVSALAVDQFEIEANGFAAELLMPRAWLIEEVKRQTTKSAKSAKQLVKDLAETFGVSAQAMQYRLENLGLLYPA